jgi:murein DD-endopeptidase MepM/ murein hydrolase activator NlpD
MRGLWLAALPPTVLLLLVSLAAPSIPGAAATPRRGSTKSSAVAATPAIYLVTAGDTLTAIASRHRVTIAALLSANRLSSSSARLRVGQRLVIPSVAGAVARATGAVAAATGAGARVRKMLPAVATRRPPALPKTLVLALPDFSELTPLFVWPVDGQVSSTFGRRRMGWHKGIDIKADLGMPVAAAAAGTVVVSGYETRYGRVIKIEHLNGFMTVYAHNDQNLVEAGNRVAPGQLIAAVGRTGRATAHHVHFEIRQAGLAYNPLYMLPLPPRAALLEETDEEDHEDTDD